MSFLKWGVKIQSIKISENLSKENRNKAILALNGSINKNSNEILRKIIWKFKNNSKSINISLKVFNTLMLSNLGMTSKVFQKMKNLPIKKDDVKSKKLNKFEFLLNKISHNGINKAFRNLISIS